MAFTSVNAQCDPWIIKAYQELYRRTPSSTECNIRNYNNGSWNNYTELVSYIKKYNSQASTPSVSCDPWIVQIYKNEFGREPNATECNIKNYNNGSWSSYDQLKGYIRQYKTQTTAATPSTSCDAWIIKAYQELYRRTPSATECNIRNYNNGSWNNYNELVNYIKRYNSQAAAPATSCDPWIVDIYKKEFGREPNATECNIRNYNNGSWANYDQLKGFIKQYKGVSTTPKNNTDWKYTPSIVSGDPWITEIYQELYRRKPNAWEYNVYNYAEGKWKNKIELKQAIQQYQSNMQKAGITIDLYDMSNGRFVVDMKINGKSAAVSLIEGKGGNVVAAGGANVVSAGGANAVSAGGANVVSAGGANVVSAGGANVVSAGGANVVSAGGANVVAPGGANVISVGGGNVIAPGGGNLVVNASAAGFNTGKVYSVNSGARKVIRTSGNGAIVIK